MSCLHSRRIYIHCYSGGWFVLVTKFRFCFWNSFEIPTFEGMNRKTFGQKHFHHLMHGTFWNWVPGSSCCEQILPLIQHFFLSQPIRTFYLFPKPVSFLFFTRFMILFFEHLKDVYIYSIFLNTVCWPTFFFQNVLYSCVLITC